MTTLNLEEFRHDKFAVVGFSVPERLIPIIDRFASREFIARSAWLRKTVLAALAKDEAAQ
jgi:metal-responsive CopG/Arc/MetJ family transcriptional regulator